MRRVILTVLLILLSISFLFVANRVGWPGEHQDCSQLERLCSGDPMELCIETGIFICETNNNLQEPNNYFRFSLFGVGSFAVFCLIFIWQPNTGSTGRGDCTCTYWPEMVGVNCPVHNPDGSPRQ